MASEPPLDRNESDWLIPVTLPDAEAIELPAPDEKAFATEYRPWRTVILGDGSEPATHPALDAVTQWADTPAGRQSRWHNAYYAGAELSATHD